MDYLLDLDGEVMVIHDEGYWVKFDVKQVQETAERPHGIDYSLTLHGPDNKRIIGFDNAHPVPPAKWGEPQDHEHRKKSIRPYNYTSAEDLLKDFWTAVLKAMSDRGIDL